MRPRPPPSPVAPGDWFGWPAIAIFAVALAVRLVHIWQIRPAPFFAVLLGDSQAYDTWALQIAGGDWVGREAFYQAPLYPYFLGALYALVGRDLVAVRLVQAFIGSAACVFLALAARRLFSKPAGIAAGLILALYAPVIFSDALLQKSVLDVFFICLALCVVSHAILQPRRRAVWLGLGLTLGCLSLTRENSLVLVAVVVLWLLAQRSRLGLERFKLGGIFLIGIALVLLPVAARNAIVGGEFALTTAQFGPNFYIGNNERADGTYMSLRSGRGAPEYERQDATALAERALGRSLTAGEVSSYWAGRALAYIRTRPADWVRLLARKFVLLWNATEVLDTESQGTHAEWSLILRLTSPFGHFGVLAPLALFGMWITWSHRKRLALLQLMLAAYAASVVLFYVFARYRLPLVPFLVLFASAGLVEARRFFRERPGGQLAVCGAATAVVAICCNLPLLSQDRMRAITEHNLGAALQEQGRYEESIVHYRRAIALSSEYAPAYSNLGALLRATGRLDEAIQSYRKAIHLEPGYPSAHYNIANALLAQGQAREAADHFRRALELDPQWVEARNNLGIALATQGELQEAMRCFRQVLDLQPASAEGHYNLGNVLAELGDADQAIGHFRRALSERPDYFAAHYDLAGVLLERGELADAIAHLRRALEIDPSSVEAHNNLGIALASAGRLDEAVDHFSQALHLRPDFADARRNLATALEARERLRRQTRTPR